MRVLVYFVFVLSYCLAQKEWDFKQIFEPVEKAYNKLKVRIHIDFFLLSWVNLKSFIKMKLLRVEVKILYRVFFFSSLPLKFLITPPIFNFYHSENCDGKPIKWAISWFIRIKRQQRSEGDKFISLICYFLPYFAV